MSILTVGTYNVYKRASFREFIDDMQRLVATNTDLIGLQECTGSQRRDALAVLPGWGVHQPEGRQAAKDPIVWRESRFALVDAGSDVGAKGFAGGQPRRYLNWVELDDRITGRTVYLINTHLHAGIDRNGKPRVWRPRTRQAFGHIEGVRDLARWLGTQGEVFVTGDFNICYRDDRRVRHPRFPYMVLKGARLVPCWEWAQVRRWEETHGRRDRLIDYVYHQRSRYVTPASVRILDSKFYNSDHNPVLATYNIT